MTGAEMSTVIYANTSTHGPVNADLQKFFAIIIVTFVCQLQAFSRSIYVKISNIIAIFKIAVLFLIAIAGLAAIGGARRHPADMIQTPYGMANLRSDLTLRTANPFQYSLAMLNIMRAFLGFENANYVSVERLYHSRGYKALSESHFRC